MGFSPSLSFSARAYINLTVTCVWPTVTCVWPTLAHTCAHIHVLVCSPDQDPRYWLRGKAINNTYGVVIHTYTYIYGFLHTHADTNIHTHTHTAYTQTYTQTHTHTHTHHQDLDGRHCVEVIQYLSLGGGASSNGESLSIPYIVHRNLRYLYTSKTDNFVLLR